MADAVVPDTLISLGEAIKRAEEYHKLKKPSDVLKFVEWYINGFVRACPEHSPDNAEAVAKLLHIQTRAQALVQNERQRVFDRKVKEAVIAATEASQLGWRASG